jgi:hypothetical protein
VLRAGVSAPRPVEHGSDAGVLLPQQRIHSARPRVRNIAAFVASAGHFALTFIWSSDRGSAMAKYLEARVERRLDRAQEQ